MAKIIERPVRFMGAPGADGHRVYYVATGETLSYESPSVDCPDVDDNGYVNMDLSELLPNTEGVFDLGLVAFDVIGNEGDMEVKPGVPLDNVPPGKPGSLEFL